jgi:hypothetical protein
VTAGEVLLPQTVIITKSVVLDSRSRVESGQCLPDSDGWVLMLIDPVSRAETELFRGYYEHCRILQQQWHPGIDLQSEIERVTVEAEVLRKKNSSFIKRVSGRFRGRSG